MVMLLPFRKLILPALLVWSPPLQAVYPDSIFGLKTTETTGAICPTNWFSEFSEAQRNWIYKDTNAKQAERTNLLYHLTRHPEDDEAYYKLAQPHSEYNLWALYYYDFHEPGCATNELYWIAQYRALFSGNYVYAANARNMSKEFILRLRSLQRDIAYEQLSAGEVATRLNHWLVQEETLRPDEVEILRRALEKWAGVRNSPRILSAFARAYLREFRDKAVVLNPETEYTMARYDSRFHTFIRTEKALQGRVSSFIAKDKEQARYIFLSTFMKHAATAISVYPTHPGYKLATLEPENLAEFMQHRGITHYRTLGQDVPTCCVTALNSPDMGSDAAVAVLHKQTQALDAELQALIPRCYAALGTGHARWEPVEINVQKGPSPQWPDASAVNLPTWNAELLGLPNDSPETLNQAFEADLQALSTQMNAVGERGMLGCVLADALNECDRVRPSQRDFTTPVYLGIALCYDGDGLTVDLSPYDGSYNIRPSTYHTGEPIVDEALSRIPQHLHRITLQLAMLENKKHSHQLAQACGQLAKLLNRHDLWPLVICQRELRGFSPQALIELFCHYEGESDKLFAYGEAMGMRQEMRLARLGNEDDLGENLRHAARISGALPCTAEEREQSINTLLKIAKEHAYDDDDQLTGSIILHLLRHGAGEQLIQWQDCPVRYFLGRFSASGLYLVQLYLQKGETDRAQQLLSAMQADATTNTMPAYRCAKALAEQDPAKAESLRRDALLLAILYREVDHRIYEDYRDYQAAHGHDIDLLVRAELLHSNGRNAGITPTMGFRFAQEGKWQQACFVFEYLLTEGLTTATPYGLVPSQADLCYYRSLANICRSRLNGDKAAAQKAAEQLAGTPASQAATTLATLNAPTIPIKEQAATSAQPLFAADALPAREWKLRNGSTLHGQLIGVYQSPRAIRLREDDGTVRLVLHHELAESPDAYIGTWLQANGFCRRTLLAFTTKTSIEINGYCRPIKAWADLAYPGEYVLRMQQPDGVCYSAATKQMEGKTKDELLAYAHKHADDNLQMNIAANPEEAIAMAAERNLPVVVLFANAHERQGQRNLSRYMFSHPEAAQLWNERYILLPIAFPPNKPGQLGVRPSDKDLYPQETHEQMLRLEQQFLPTATADNSQLVKALQNSPAFNSTSMWAVILSPGKAESFNIYPAPSVAPEQFFNIPGTVKPYFSHENQ